MKNSINAKRGALEATARLVMSVLAVSTGDGLADKPRNKSDRFSVPIGRALMPFTFLVPWGLLDSAVHEMKGTRPLWIYAREFLITPVYIAASIV